MDLIAISALALALSAASAWLVVLVVRGRRAEWRFEILGEIAAIPGEAGSLEETFVPLCDAIVPKLADFCMIDLFEDGEAKRAAVGVAPGAGPGFEQRLREREPSLPGPMVADDGGDALRSRFMERVGEQELRSLAHDDGPDLEFLRRVGVRSAITVPLQTRGRVKGALTIAVAWSRRRYGPEDERFARILAGRVALALDNSGLFADLERAERSQAEIAQTLQHGLLPPPLPHIPGWSLAAMYRPAGAENEVGGDFYDAFTVTGGWMLVIGDVTGRGAEAASITALARYTLRTAAMLTNDPEVALATVNRALLARDGTALCSVAAVAIGEDPAEPVRIAVAGHPPPLLVDGEDVREVEVTDPVLGAFGDVEWRVDRLQIERGQQLVMVTDGVIEAYADGERFGEERLRSELAGADNPAAAVQRLEGALRSFTDGNLDDDAAVLVVARSKDDRPRLGTRALVGVVGDANE